MTLQYWNIDKQICTVLWVSVILSLAHLLTQSLWGKFSWFWTDGSQVRSAVRPSVRPVSVHLLIEPSRPPPFIRGRRARAREALFQTSPGPSASFVSLQTDPIGGSFVHPSFRHFPVILRERSLCCRAALSKPKDPSSRAVSSTSPVMWRVTHRIRG